MNKSKKTENRMLLPGNEAMGEAALRAGCTFYAGYPITPQNELTAYMARQSPTYNATFIQAESELAAINMVFGAAAAGARAMTSSSSPGISLKQEGISYSAGAQLPCLIINVMRSGPGLGGISTSQSDYFQATKGGGHGDYRLIVLAPHSVQEAFALVGLGFELADQYRNPVMILADAIIGQMMEPVVLPEAIDATTLPQKPWALDGAAGRKKRVVKSFFLRNHDLAAHNIRLQEKYAQIQEKEERFECFLADDAQILLVSFGSQARISKEAVEVLRQQNVPVGLFRPISLWPFPTQALQEAARRVKHVVVVEQNFGQMVEDVRLSIPGTRVHFFGKAGGAIPTVEETVARVKELV